MKIVSGGITAVPGIRAIGIHAGLRSNGRHKDLALIVSDSPALAAGVFTKNQFAAPPVQLCREQIKNQRAKAIIVNSKYANACTGHRGMADARKMVELTAEALKIPESLVLIASTGLIGETIPMEKIHNSIGKAAESLSVNGSSSAAEAIMTTDTVPKELAVVFELDGKTATIGAIAKGSGMIAPNMATMLAFIATDAKISPEALQTALDRSVKKTFNRITVDSDTSTNDTVLLLANGEAGNSEITEPIGNDFEKFSEALEFICEILAKMIARDGEGATKLIEVIVKNAKSEADGELVGRAIAESPLVKTAIFGKDPNWGRIAAAVGKAPVEIAPSKVDIWFDRSQIVKDGVAHEFDRKTVSEYLHGEEIKITVDLNSGEFEVTFWTCDYSYEYIRINAEYHT